MKKQENHISNGIRVITDKLKEYKFSIVIVFLFIGIATYLQVEAPKLIGTSIDKLGKYIMAYKAPNLDSTVPKENFTNEIFKMIYIYIGIALTIFVYTFVMAGVSANAGGKIRKSLFDKIQKLSIRFFDKSSDGDILSRFTNDIDNISNLLNQAFVQVISSLAVIIAIGYTMFKENVKLSLLVIGLALINMILNTFFTRKASKYVELQQQNLGELNGYIDEKISGQKLIITTGIEEEVNRDFQPFNDDYREASIKGQSYSNVLFPLTNGFMLLSMAIVIYFGADLISKGTITVGLLVTFIMFIQRFFQPITQVVSQYNVIRLGLTGAGRVKEILDEEEDIVNKEVTIDMPELKNKLEIKNLTFGYDRGKDVLKNINITVEKGKKVALVGPTGSGKTTIMNLLNRFYDIEEGEILYDGINIKEFRLEELRRNVGIVLQDSVLFSGTIRENISYGQHDINDEKIYQAAKLANIHDYITTLENGYNTEVDNSSSVFSVGQKQLISIARTIITNPELLILDEATSNVDTVTEAKIQKAMANVLKDRTSFVIAHRLKTILDSDKIIVLKDGEVIEEGTHSELLKQGGFYSELYYNQFVIEK